jgi:hypothetical protein
MLERYFDKILYVTGLVTVTPLLQFFLPNLNLGLSGLVVGDDTGLLFARHWGLMAACFGVLLIFAATRPTVRIPIVMAAMVEKLGLVALIALSWNTPALAGLHLAALFDGACVLLYGAYIYQIRNT